MKKKLIVKNIIKETEDTITLVFAQETGEEKLQYEAGQYLHLFIDDRSKMYTLSSAPYEDFIHISVKKHKDFSLLLHELKIGDEIEYLGPFGFLTLSEIDEDQKDYDMVILSAGIGITPFYSILKEKAREGFSDTTHLFYANKDREHTIFYQQFSDMEKEHPNFHVHHYWSVEDNKLSLEKIKNEIKDFDSKIFLICGPTLFVEDFWKQLKDVGVDEDVIYTESFFAQ